jgi:hypothetical protein
VTESPQPQAQVPYFQCGGERRSRRIAKLYETPVAVVKPPHRHIEPPRPPEKRVHGETCQSAQPTIAQQHQVMQPEGGCVMKNVGYEAELLRQYFDRATGFDQLSPLRSGADE